MTAIQKALLMARGIENEWADEGTGASPTWWMQRAALAFERAGLFAATAQEPK
jgi:hypothetical protein